MKQPDAPAATKLKELEGKWYIHYSDFPMWLKGDKRFPTFNYTVGTRGSTPGLHDEVRYVQKGRKKSIVGFDTPTHPDGTSFEWRGKGLLSLLKSRWELLHVESGGQWALIHFQKTLFTPEGYDVMSRTVSLTAVQQQQIQEKLRELGIKANLGAIEQQEHHD